MLDLLEIENRLRLLRKSNHLFSLDSFFFFLSLSLSFLLRLFCKRILVAFRKEVIVSRRSRSFIVESFIVSRRSSRGRMQHGQYQQQGGGEESSRRNPPPRIICLMSSSLGSVLPPAVKLFVASVACQLYSRYAMPIKSPRCAPEGRERYLLSCQSRRHPCKYAMDAAVFYFFYNPIAVIPNGPNRFSTRSLPSLLLLVKESPPPH